MNKIIKNESAITIFGIEARAFNVIADTLTGRILNQKIGTSKYYTEGGTAYRIGVELRFDDECGNGHETLAITGAIYRQEKNSRWIDESGGCIHEDIAKRFPSLAPLIRWHLTSTDGPMHYVANTCYLASDRDCYGRQAGEPSSYNHAVTFGKSPALHMLETAFYKFLSANIDRAKDFTLRKIEHAKEPGGYEFDPKFTIAGYCDKWHECPFNTQAEAEAFIKALNLPGVEFHNIPTAFVKGKARELDAARRVAVWPDATDEELSAPRDVLTATLNARLPTLLTEFKADTLACGFIWPEHTL